MAVEETPRLTLYGRPYCHLCDDMAQALQPLLREFGAELVVVDVDGDAEQEEKYGELVPVLFLGPERLCHYFVDIAAVRARLKAFRDARAPALGGSC